jgi:hypothetical protein
VSSAKNYYLLQKGIINFAIINVRVGSAGESENY